jgi:hypothetical protein
MVLFAVVFLYVPVTLRLRETWRPFSAPMVSKIPKQFEGIETALECAKKLFRENLPSGSLIMAL